MAKEIKLPQLGQTMEEGTIVTCLIKVGDKVEKGDVIFEVETDKATLEMESPADGFVKKILVEVGATVPVNTVLLIVGEENEEVADAVETKETETQSASEPAKSEPAASPEKQPAKPASSSGRLIASPRAKAIARKLGVDLSQVTPADGGVRITEDDVRKAAEAGGVAAAVEPAQKPGERIKVTRMQKIVGQRMLQSKREIPCFYLSVKADVTEMVKLRVKLNKELAKDGVKVAFNDFIIHAIAGALKQYPVMTGQLDSDHIQLAEKIGVGLAISVEDGLVAPIIQDADKKSLRQVAESSVEIIARAKANKLTPDDFSGGCITVSNLGGFGIDSFIPIVVPGQCSILGVGRIADTAVPTDGNILVRKLLNLTLSVDHKVANGAYAAAFLDAVRKGLEHFEK